eukprot:gene5680-6381_t
MDLCFKFSHDELKCPVCKNTFVNPKVLPCLHACCGDCLTKFASFGHSFRCYTCLEEVDKHTVSTLPDDFARKRASDVLLLSTALGSEGSPALQCTACSCIDKRASSGRFAVAKCQDCQDYLCQACTNAHAVTKLTKHHQVYKFDELTSRVDANSNTQVEHCPVDDSRRVKCARHGSEFVRYFCITCEAAVCSECLIEKHRQHQLASIEEHGDTQRTKLAVRVMKSEGKMKEIEDGLNLIQNLSKNIQLNAENAKLDVKEHIMQRRKDLDSIEGELLQEIDLVVKKKHSCLQEQAKELDKTFQKLKTACSFSGRVLKSASEVELMLLKKHIESRLVILDGERVELNPRHDDAVSYNQTEGGGKKIVKDCFGEIIS